MHVAPSDVGCMGMGGAAMIVTGERGGGDTEKVGISFIHTTAAVPRLP